MPNMSYVTSFQEGLSYSDNSKDQSTCEDDSTTFPWIRVDCSKPTVVGNSACPFPQPKIKTKLLYFQSITIIQDIYKVLCHT